MRIGFITYEFPPDIAQGGIATYVQQASLILQNRGHEVEVFCGSHERTVIEKVNGILIHRLQTVDPASFSRDIVDIFSMRHLEQSFDIIESPEIHANALLIKEKFPNLPLVVKLHMPLYLQMQLINFYIPWWIKLRFFFGALRRGRIKFYGQYNFKKDVDYQLTSIADGIVSPSTSLKHITIRNWRIKERSITVIPYPFKPSQKLFDVSLENHSQNTISFIGKLNVQKGVINLIKVIKKVSKRHPNVMFRLVGNDSNVPLANIKMSVFIKEKLKGFEKNYIITGGLSYDEVMSEIENTSICIFPSIWENFPLVCLEAMSAGRAIIGSKQGGMKEMLSEGAGILIDPLDIHEMTDAVLQLLNNQQLRQELGATARQKLLSNYNSDIIGEKMEQHFIKVISKKMNIDEN